MSEPETIESDHIKAWLLVAAYQGAIAVLGGTKTVNIGGQNVPVNPDAGFQDPGVRALATMVFEEAKIQYQPILAAYQDQTGIFPNPHVAQGVSPGLPALAATGAAVAQAAANPGALVAQLSAAALQALIAAAQQALANQPPAVPTLGH